MARYDVIRPVYVLSFNFNIAVEYIQLSRYGILVQRYSRSVGPSARVFSRPAIARTTTQRARSIDFLLRCGHRVSASFLPLGRCWLCARRRLDHSVLEKTRTRRLHLGKKQTNLQ